MSDNLSQAKQIIAVLKENGVRSFCICPGSWSTSLAEAINRDEEVEKTVHFDERGAAFFALGVAKESKRPVAIITTSGTAVGNLLPAVMEADRACIPLILLTADRPPEQQRCGANQTSEQTEIFRSFVRYTATLPPSSPTVLPWIAQTVAEGIHAATSSLPGPIHLNWQLRKPFLPDAIPTAPSSGAKYFSSAPLLPHEDLKEIADLLSSKEKGVILLGELPQGISPEPIIAFSEKLGWPIIADLLSGMRGSVPCIPHFELIQKQEPQKFSTLLQFGDRFVDQETPATLLTENSTYVFVNSHNRRHDPCHLVTHRLVADPILFCQSLLPHLPAKEISPLYTPSISTVLEEHFTPQVEISELLLPYLLSNDLDETSLFIGNSMPIRDFSLLYYPPNKRSKIYANRGLSGIDGNIATAIGIARSSNKPLIAVIGDQTFLHDLNSLFLLKPSDNIAFIVINNGGGAIFSFLPIAEKSVDLETAFAASHNHALSKLIEPFSITTEQITKKEEWKKALTKWKKTRQSAFFEVITDRSENVIMHNALQKGVKEKICCLTQ